MSAFQDARLQLLRAMGAEGVPNDFIRGVRELPHPGRDAADAAWRRAFGWLLPALRGDGVGPAYRLAAELHKALGGPTNAQELGALYVRLDVRRDELVTALYRANLAVESWRVQELAALEERGAAQRWLGTLANVAMEVERELADDHDEGRIASQRRSLALIRGIVDALSPAPDAELTKASCEGASCSACDGSGVTFEGVAA